MSDTEKPKRRASALDLPIPDRAAMQAYVAEVPEDQRLAALDRAQDMISESWERQTSHARKVGAHKALAVSPLCADAFTLLASETIGKETRDLYERAVLAGELALGPGALETFAGHFWGFFETRPYMRAREALANDMLVRGEEEGAIAHFRDMLKLNPNDNQGIRYSVLNALLGRDELEAAKALLADYPDDGGVDWLYGRLLVAWREGEASAPSTRELLLKALSANRHVPALLAPDARLVHSHDDGLRVGGEEEASHYRVYSRRAWEKAEGAVEWLRSAAAGVAAPKRGGSKRIQ